MKRGSTLIEALLAVVILSVGMVGVIRAYLTLLGALSLSRHTIDSAGLLKEKMQDLEQKEIEDRGLSIGSDQGEFAIPYQGFTWAAEVSSFSNAAATGELKESLNTLLVTVYDNTVKPARKFSAATYARNRKQ